MMSIVRVMLSRTGVILSFMYSVSKFNLSFGTSRSTFFHFYEVISAASTILVLLLVLILVYKVYCFIIMTKLLIHGSLVVCGRHTPLLLCHTKTRLGLKNTESFHWTYLVNTSTSTYIRHIMRQIEQFQM